MTFHSHLRALEAFAPLAVGLAVTALIAAACGGPPRSRAPLATYLAGQVPKSELPTSGTATDKGDSSNSTIPLAQQNPTTQLFAAIGSFQSCLQGLGVTFIGAPSGNDPNNPANNPSYIKSLATCAAQSNILQALKTEQSAQDNLTQAQIHKENNQYLKWRTCMIGHGWGIPTPAPNSQGLLFSFGGSSSVSNITPPPGKSLLSSGDMEACASSATG